MPLGVEILEGVGGERYTDKSTQTDMVTSRDDEDCEGSEALGWRIRGKNFLIGLGWRGSGAQ